MHIERTRVARRPQANELVNSIIAENPKPKLTHKLPPMICVLWLRDLRG